MWKRPAGPLNVWNVIECSDKNGNKFKASIQEVPNDEHRHQEIMDILTNNYLKDEPINKVLNVTEDPDSVSDYQNFFRICLSQGLAVGAYKLDSNGKITKFMGTNLLYFVDDAFNEEMKKFFSEMKSEKLKNLLRINEDFKDSANICKIYGIKDYLTSISLSVYPEYRGQKLGYHMLCARDKIGVKYGFKATITIFSAAASQAEAKRAGFEEFLSKDYKYFTDENGKPLYPNIECQSLKIMAKRIILP